MNSQNTLQVVRLMLGLIELSQAAGFDMTRLTEAQNRARSEGRDLTDEEIEAFRNDALASIKAAQEA